jgi:hypothetical protein
MNRRLTTGEIIRGTGALLAAHPLPALAAIGVLTVAGAALDLRPEGAQSLRLVVSIGSMILQFAITRTLLKREKLWRAPGRVGSFVGVGIVTGLAIALGALLLIVPGLYLFARWSITMPLVIGEGKTMGEAMQESRDATSSNLAPIMLAVAVLNLGWVGGVLLFGFGYPDYGLPPVPMAFAANLLVLGTLTIDWYLAVAIYKLVGTPAEGLDEVFA